MAGLQSLGVELEQQQQPPPPLAARRSPWRTFSLGVLTGALVCGAVALVLSHHGEEGDEHSTKFVGIALPGSLAELEQRKSQARVSASRIWARKPSGSTGLSMQYGAPPAQWQDANSLNEMSIEERKIQEEAAKRRAEAQKKKDIVQMKIDRMNAIPEDAEAGTVADFMYKDGVKEMLDQLDYELIGLEGIKSRVNEIASLLVVDKLRRNLGLETSVPSLHMVFTGPPGTGKTTVALKMGMILQRMGYCRSGHVVLATRDDLVGQYVGHTAPKTKEVIKKAMGGILFVDEAYYLYNAANDRDYGQESIEILLNVMENNKEDLVVILAGYKDRMDKFFSYIPGMSSRIGNQLDFPNYEIDDLIEISKVMVRELEYDMDLEATHALRGYLLARMQMPFFSNARTVRNAVDLARMRAAVRLFHEKTVPGSDGMVSKHDLKQIKACDIPPPDVA